MQRSLRHSRVLFQSKAIPFPSTSSIIIQRPYHIARPASAYRIVPLVTQHVSYFHQHACHRQQAAAAAVEAEVEEQLSGSRPPSDGEIDKQTHTGPMTKFSDLKERGVVNDKLIDTLTRKMGLTTMTEVQSRTISEALTGVDVLAQAKTGTGKTIGFLLPILQNIISNDPELAAPRKRQADSRMYSRKGGAADIRSIVISPTRELAEQIAVEANKLVQGTGIVIQTAVGGTQKGRHLGQMQREGCHILVGTPGRLKDIFSDQNSGVQAPKLSAFVLDEADRLMDAGFWPEIEEIQTYLPKKSEQDRQTLMFSATIPEDVVHLVRKVMKPNLHYVKTVQENEEPTHERVKQSIVHVAGLENQIPAVLELCNREIMAHAKGINPRPFKAIIYFNATAETTLAADILYKIRQRTQNGPATTSGNDTHDTSILGMKTRVYSIHSRLTQGARTAAAEHFRESNSAILCSSDVTARGMDFPNVTHVIQVGLPPTRDSYIHRLGRTARAGREGEGWLILPSLAKRELNYRLGKLPLIPDTSLATAAVDLSTTDNGSEPNMSREASAFFDAVSVAASEVDPEKFERTYMAILGTSQWMNDKQQLVEHMNRLARVQWGMSKPPALGRGLINKLGLARVVGLNKSVDPDRPREVRDYGSRGPRDGDREKGAGRVRGFGGDESRGSSSRDSRGGFEKRGSVGFGGDRDDRGSSRGFGGGSGGYDGKRRSEGRSDFQRSDRGDRGDRGFGGRDGERSSGGGSDVRRPFIARNRDETRGDKPRRAPARQGWD